MTYVIKYMFQIKPDLNIHVFNMIARKIESEVLTKDISCECKCKFEGKNVFQIKSGITRYVDCECKKRHICEKEYMWNPVTCSCKNGKYLASVIDDSVITCDEIIEETKEVPINFNEKYITCKTQNFYIFLPFY